MFSGTFCDVSFLYHRSCYDLRHLNRDQEKGDPIRTNPAAADINTRKNVVTLGPPSCQLTSPTVHNVLASSRPKRKEKNLNERQQNCMGLVRVIAGKKKFGLSVWNLEKSFGKSGYSTPQRRCSFASGHS